jgi:fused
LISLCEIFEQIPEYGTDWFSLVCTTTNETNLFDAYFKCMLPDETQLQKLIELTKGDRDLAEERQEDLLHLGVAILAAFTYIPLNITIKAQALKFKVSKFLAAKLLEISNLTFTENWLVFLRHPTSCINVLKALYSTCMSSSNMCLFLSKSNTHMNALYDILSEKIDLPVIVVNEIVELTIHVICTIIIQLYEMPMNNGESAPITASITQVSTLEKISNNLASSDLFWDERFYNITGSATLLFNIFLQSQIASHTAAGALLFNQLLLIGCPCEVQPDTMIESAISVLTDLTQIQVRCPFNYGIIDGLLMLLNQMLNQVIFYFQSWLFFLLSFG